MEGKAGKKRIVELDFLRGIAVFMILATHYPVLPFFSRFFIALDFFFVLSGFLVAGLLIKDVHEQGKANVIRFLIRRGLKIYPSFYFYLFFTVGLTMLFRSNGIPLFEFEISWRTIVAEVFYVQNYFEGIWPHDWSLGLEEQFYLLLAFLFFALKKFANSVKVIAIISVLIMFVVFILRYIYIIHMSGTDLHPITMAHLRIDAIFAGVLCSCAYHLYRDKFHNVPVRCWIWSIGAGALIAIGSAQVLLYSPVSHIYAYNIFYLGSSLLVVGLYMLGISDYQPWVKYFQKQKWVKIISYIGRHSYNIYLWHVFVLSSVFAIFHATGDANIWSPLAWRYLIIYGGASIVLGILMAKLIEIPVLMWRDRKMP